MNSLSLPEVSLVHVPNYEVKKWTDTLHFNNLICDAIIFSGIRKIAVRYNVTNEVVIKWASGSFHPTRALEDVVRWTIGELTKADAIIPYGGW